MHRVYPIKLDVRFVTVTVLLVAIVTTFLLDVIIITGQKGTLLYGRKKN